jgi:hypothetical protein
MRRLPDRKKPNRSYPYTLGQKHCESFHLFDSLLLSFFGADSTLPATETTKTAQH